MAAMMMMAKATRTRGLRRPMQASLCRRRFSSLHPSALQVQTSGHWRVESIDARSKSICAAERVKWLASTTTRRVLALSSDANEHSRLHRYVNEHMAFNELERRGHGVFGVMQWCQQALEETSNDKRVFPRGRMAALLMHHLKEMPLERFQRAMTSPLMTRKAVMDLLQLFQLLESEGISPAAYTSNASSTEDPEQIELALAYELYRKLLEEHRVTSWDGMVLDALELSAVSADIQSSSTRWSEFTDAMLRGFTDVVVDDLQSMSPAMVKLVANLCAHPNIESSVSFSRVLVDGDECPRGLLLDQVLQDAHKLSVSSVMLQGYAESSTRQSSSSVEIRARAQQILSPQSKDRSLEDATLAAVKCFKFDTVSNEELTIGKLIKDRLGKSPEQSIAVLAPTHVDAQRLAQAFLSQGIAVQDHASAVAVGNHLFDEVCCFVFSFDGVEFAIVAGPTNPVTLLVWLQPGVNAVFSLLVALCYPSDSRHLYNVLRSSFFDLSPQILSKLMEKELKTHADLFRVLEAFVETKGNSLYSQDSNTIDEVLRAGIEAELLVAAKFVDVIKRLRSECHEKSTQEIVQAFLEETGESDSAPIYYSFVAHRQTELFRLHWMFL